MYMQLQGTFLKTRPLFCIASSSPPNNLYSTIKGNSKGLGWYGSQNTKHVHASAIQNYSYVKPLPLPVNVEEINATEKACFSPHRNRDISGPVILSKFEGTFRNGFMKKYNKLSQPVDAHIASYDCTGPVSLRSSMQTNVPNPYSSKGKSTHLNMPGGQWGQGYKYISQDLQNTHYRNTCHSKEEPNSSGSGIMTISPFFQDRKYFHSSSSSVQNGFLFIKKSRLTFNKSIPFQTNIHFSTSMDSDSGLTRKEKLKRAVKEYGSTVIVFHVGISLISLGSFYLAVSSGLDVRGILQYFGGGESEIAAGASTFVMAYAIHKLFAPVRISITLASTPFIVRYLRRVGFLKAPKQSSTTT